MSYEKEKERLKRDPSFYDERVRIPILKYFWQASPLSNKKDESIHLFLRSLDIFSAFGDYEIRVMSEFLHFRNLSKGEVLFREGDSSFGFYFIFNGEIELYSSQTSSDSSISEEDAKAEIVRLRRGNYLGELSLLESQSHRNASSLAIVNTSLLACFKPDLEELIEKHPIVAAKFLQAISLVVARRFTEVAAQLRELKEKLLILESEKNEES